MAAVIPKEVHRTGKSLIWVFKRVLDSAEQKEVEAEAQDQLAFHPRLVVNFTDVDRDFTIMVAHVRDSR